MWGSRVVSDQEVEELVRGFEVLNREERGTVLRLLKLMSARVKPQGMSRGYAKCADCKEHTLCYAKQGIMRCDKCRRKQGNP